MESGEDERGRMWNWMMWCVSRFMGKAEDQWRPTQRCQGQTVSQ